MIHLDQQQTGNDRTVPFGEEFCSKCNTLKLDFMGDEYCPYCDLKADEEGVLWLKEQDEI